MDKARKQCSSKQAGKKRKKAITKGKETPFVPVEKCKTSPKTEFKQKLSPEEMLASILLVHKLDDHQHSSSDSSIENHKPSCKQQKFEESSPAVTTPETPSTSQDTTSLSSGASSMSCTSTQLQQKNDTGSVMDTGDPAVEATHDNSSCTKRVDVNITLETLRWENELSDEEQEKARIEEYKLKRRQRYQEALTLHRQQLASNRTKNGFPIISKK